MGHVQRLFASQTRRELEARRLQLIDQHRVELAILEAAEDGQKLHPVTKDLYRSRLLALGELIAEADARIAEATL